MYTVSSMMKTYIIRPDSTSSTVFPIRPTTATKSEDVAVMQLQTKMQEMYVSFNSRNEQEALQI